MSPACAVRKGQQWLSEMVEDMADGLLNLVEHKVLRSMASEKIDYNSPIADKIKEVKQSGF